MLVGDWECEEWLWLPLYEATDKLGFRAGFDAVVAASKRGLTALAVGGAWGVDEKDALGVCEPVPLGVARFDGNSLMNIVAELGDTRYRLLRVVNKASLNPRTFDPDPQITNASQASCLFEISSTDRIVR
jgi:hypothetical protein